MKKTFLSGLLLFVAAATLFGCSKDETTDPATADIATISATVEEPTRTKLDGEKVKWVAGDKIMLANASNATAEYTLKTGKGTTSGTFTGKNLGAGEKFALYPYSATATCAGGKFSFEMPAKQYNGNIPFGDGSNPMIAQSDAEGVLNFKNMCGVIRLQLKGAQRVYQIVAITARSDEKLSGKATVALDANGLPELTLDASATNTVALHCNSAWLNTTTATSFFVVVPAATYTAGLQFLIYNESGTHIYSLTTRKELIVTRSQVASLPVKTITEMNFPDANFRAALAAEPYNLKLTADGDIDVDDAANQAKFASTTQIDVAYAQIASLQGINYFKKLKTLNCYNNKLTSLELYQNTALTHLHCSDNQLTRLDLYLNTALTHLYCHNNLLTDYLCIKDNKALTALYCHNNLLTVLDVSSCLMLTKLACGNQHANGGTGTPYTKLTLTRLESQKALILMPDETAYNNEVVCIKPIAFPDANFRTVLAEKYKLNLTTNGTDIDMDDGYNLKKFTEITQLDFPNQQIASLQGIEYFTALTHIDGRSNQLESLDIRKNTALTYLDCSDNQLTSLDVSQNTALTELYCYANQLESLDISPCSRLTMFNCSDNLLPILDVSKNTALTQLYCHANLLVYLDVSKNTKLTKLYSYANKMVSLDISACSRLTNLACGNQHVDGYPAGVFNELWLIYSGNQEALATKPEEAVYNKRAIFERIITFPDANFRAVLNQSYGLILTANQADIDVNNTDNIKKFTEIRVIDVEQKDITTLQGIECFTELQKLYCAKNQLASLDLSKNTKLIWLVCDANQLTSLDVSQNTALIWLVCDANQLTSLDVSKNTVLKGLYCHDNQLKSLNIGNNINLSGLHCYANQLESLDISPCVELRGILCGNQHADGGTGETYTQLKLTCTPFHKAKILAQDKHNQNIAFTLK